MVLSISVTLLSQNVMWIVMWLGCDVFCGVEYGVTSEMGCVVWQVLDVIGCEVGNDMLVCDVMGHMLVHRYFPSKRWYQIETFRETLLSGNSMI